jgi:hypothetical protein
VALQGTLKDFGIAEIFQLIGQQAKTGVLHLRGKDEEVHVSFFEGNVVRAEHVGRRRKDLLGRMLVAAELISEERLEEALEEQKRTLQRLGDILLARDAITRERLREMAQLQATETLYRLFHWKSGTYEFDQGPVEWDRASITPIRSESVLMEGFRMVDEWPMIRKKITSYGMTFLPIRSVPEGPVGEVELDAALDGAFEGERHEAVGPNERRVFALALPGRTVQKIVDLSRLGEFETCKALLNLVDGEFLRAVAAGPAAPPTGSTALSTLGFQARVFGMRLAVTALVVAVAIALVRIREAEAVRAPGALAPGTIDPAAARLLSGRQLSRIEAALAIYRAEHGEYPDTLEPLVRDGLLRADDLRHPWSEPYYYRREPGPLGFVLRPPFR